MSNEKQNHRFYAQNIKSLARDNRAKQTVQERKMWQLIRNSKLGVKFRRQFPIDNKYFADFVCLEKRLIIEIDGEQHNNSLSDRQRTFYLENNNFRVIRFWNNEIDNNLEGCYEILLQELNFDRPKAEKKNESATHLPLRENKQEQKQCTPRPLWERGWGEG